MGWFGLWGSSEPPTSDEVKSLDPSLRSFLDQQQPKSFKPQSKTTETVYTERVAASALSSQTTNSPPKVPPQSLYQDGRYADLWKNYRPLDAIENATKSDQQKMKDLMEEQEARRAFLGMMALENCAIEHLAEQDCLRGRASISRALLCRAENHAFSRCFETQGKLLKALGYMQVVDRPEEAERVQMHADRLWQRLVEQERLIKEAKENNQPVPQFEPILASKSIGVASQLPEKLRRGLEKKVKGMEPQDAALEEAVFMADIQNQKEVGKKGLEYLKQEQDKRQQRIEDGTATMGDRMKRWWGWDDNLDKKD